MTTPLPFKSTLTYSLLSLLFLLSSCGKEKIELPWEEQTSPTTVPITSVFFTDANTGHATGGDTWYSGLYLSTTDGGVNWQVDTLSNSKMYSLHFSPSGEGGAVGNNAYLFRKQSPEDDWTFYRLSVWGVLTDIAVSDYNLAVAVGGEAFQHGRILRLEGNAILTQIDSFANEISTVYISDEQTVHAAGFGIVLRSDDAALTWTRLDIEGDFFRSIHFPSATVGYMVGSAGTIMKTDDAGQSWKKLRDGSKIKVSNIPFQDVFFVDENKGYIVGHGGVFWRTLNGGDEWQEVKSFPGADLNSVHVADGHGYIVSEEGRIFHFTD